MNDYCKEIKDYYNGPALEFLKGIQKVEKSRVEFSSIEECKKFLLKIQSDFLENPIGEEDFITDSEDKTILNKNAKNIKLKRVFIDEIGKTVTNYADELKYYYIINNNGTVFNICLENPGEGTEIDAKEVTCNGEFFTFEFIAIKPGFKENIEINKVCKNIPKESKIVFNINVSSKEIYVLPNNKKEREFNYFEKIKNEGIFTFK